MSLSIATNSWFALLVAIVFGVFGTICMKLSHGLTYKKAILSLSVFYSISFIALTFAMKTIELSIVYAVWSGIGTVLVYAISVVYFNEAISFKKIIFLTLIVFGVIGMHLGGFS